MDSALKTAIVATVFTGTAFLVLCLRCVSWYICRKNTVPEDVLMVMAMILSIVFTISVWQEVKYGLGTPFVPGNSMDEYIMFQQWLFVGAMAFGVSVTLARSSILVQLLKVFVKRSHKILCWISLVSGVVSGLYGVVAVIFLCTPIPYFWNKRMPNGHCKALGGAIGPYLIGCISDIIVWALPVYVFRSLKMPRRQKIFVIVIFGLGVFCCITPIIRLVEMMRLAGRSEGVGAFNYRGMVAPILLWRSLEINTGIICGSLPRLTPLISRFWPNLSLTGKPPNQEPKKHTGEKAYVSSIVKRTFDDSAATTQVSVSCLEKGDTLSEESER